MASLKFKLPNEQVSPQHEQILRELAQDVVRQIYEVPDILNKFGITLDEYHRLAETTPFRTMLTDAATEWEGTGNTVERVALKSALLVEKALPDMYGALVDTREPMTGRVELLKALGKMGGLGHAPPANAQIGGGGNVFRLEINFPSEPTKSIIIEHAALPLEVEPPGREFSDDLSDTPAAPADDEAE